MTKRPFVFFTSFFVLTCIFTCLASVEAVRLSLMLFAIVFFIILLLSITLKRRFLCFACFFASSVILSLLLGVFIHIPLKERALSFSGFEGSLTGEIVSVNHKNYYDRVVVKTRTVGEKKASFKIYFNCAPKVLDATEGDIILLEGTLTLPDSDFSINQNNSEKIYLHMDVDGIERLDTRPNVFKKYTYILREKCAKNFERLDNHELLSELVLGIRDSVDANVKNDFQKLGLSHALSVSGMHLSIIVMSLYNLLKKNSFEKRGLSILCSAITLTYMALTGFSFSIVRAGIMLLIYFSASLFRRKPDTVTSLFVAAFFICIENPAAVFDVSFELSFLATLGIVTLSQKSIKPISKMKFFYFPKDKISKWNFATLCKKALFKIITAFIINTSAVIFTAPITLFYFGTLTPLSFVSNISVLFLINAFLIVGVVYQILCFLNIHILSFAVNILSNTILFLTSNLAKILPAPISFSPELCNVSAVVLTVVLILSLCVFSKKLTLLLTALTLSISLLIAQGLFSFATRNTTFITLADHNLIVEEKGQKSLISIKFSDTSPYSVQQMCLYRNITSIDTAVFFVQENLSIKDIEKTIKEFDVKKIIIAGSADVIYDYKSYDLPCEVEYINYADFKLSDSVIVDAVSGEYVSVLVSHKNTDAALTYFFGEEFAIPNSYFEAFEGVALFGELEYLPHITPNDFYCYNSTDIWLSRNAQNISDTKYAFVEVNKTRAKLTPLK